MPQQDDVMRSITNKMAGGDPNTNDENEDPNQHAELVRLSEWTSQPISWLWEPMIPRRKVTLLVGDQEVGKSYFALDLAARLTRGVSIPPAKPLGEGPGNVLILQGDDESADTLVPRLQALHAEMDRIFLLTVNGPRNSGDDRPQISLTRDIDCLKQAARNISDCRLIIIDPITAFLGGMSTNNHTFVRRLFAQLTALAKAHDAAVLLITHNRKAGAGNLLNGTVGSLAFTVAARVVLAVVEDPQCAGRRLVLPAKMILQPASKCPGWAFEFEENTLAWDRQPVELRPDELARLTAKGLATSDRVLEVAEELKQVIGNRDVRAREIYEWAAENRIPRTVLYQAKSRANIRSRHDGIEQNWWWMMQPGDEIL